jgi:glycerophosphoryl diester phosphodiesterase
MNMQQKRPEIIAHRGESYDAPENTLAAFELAWQRGADAVELDVHLTADGRFVCIHDPDAHRTTGVAHRICDTSFAQLQQCDAGSWKAPGYAGQKLPAMEEVLATIPAGKRLLIEIKVGPACVGAFVDVLAQAGKPPQQTAVISFDLGTCREVKQRRRELKVYYLSSFKQEQASGKWTPTVEDLVAAATDAKLDGLDLSWRGPLDQAFVRKVREAGLEWYAWTVNEPDIARQLIALGVDGITTDRPAWLREQLMFQAAGK